MTDNQLVESIKYIEYFQHTDLKAESLISPTQSLKKLSDKDLVISFWNELEAWLKSYQDISDKHKALYNHAKKIRDNFSKINENIVSNSRRDDSTNVVKMEVSTLDSLAVEMETEKLCKRRKFVKDIGSQRDDKNLLDFWQNVLVEKNKKRFEFYGRLVNPNGITPLYTHLEENGQNKNIK